MTTEGWRLLLAMGTSAIVGFWMGWYLGIRVGRSAREAINAFDRLHATKPDFEETLDRPIPGSSFCPKCQMYYPRELTDHLIYCQGPTDEANR